MVTRISDVQATVQRQGNVTSRPWIQGERKTVTLALQDSGGDPLDLTGYTLTCRTRTFAADVEESGDGTAEEPLAAAISNFERNVEVGDGTLPVTVNADPTTGLATIVIPATLYQGVIPPDLGAGVPVVALYFSIALPGENAAIMKFRHLIYVRDGGPSG